MVSGRYKMRNTKYNIRNGFTIAELLLALSITALLMVAVGAAINASAINYQENKDIFTATNTARQVLTRITTQLRTGNMIEPNEPNDKCTFVTSGGSDITYRFDSVNQELYLDDNDANTSNLLCDNVTSMSFIKTPTGDGMDVKSVQISITVSGGNNQRTLSAAAAIRRNLDL